MTVVPNPDTIRGPIELTHNTNRDDREKQYVTERLALEADFHADLATIQTAKETALLAAGLNADGGVPESYPLPVNTVAPALSGTTHTGDTVTCSQGTWAQATSYAYQWYRNGVAIGGATASTRTLVTADVGKVLKCRVTATNSFGTTSKDSNTVTPSA